MYGPLQDWPRPPSADSATLCALQKETFSTLRRQLTTSERPASSGRRYGMQRHQSVFLVDHERKQVDQGSKGVRSNMVPKAFKHKDCVSADHHGRRLCFGYNLKKCSQVSRWSPMLPVLSVFLLRGIGFIPLVGC